MKKLIFICSAILITAHFLSCTKQATCVTVPIKNIVFYTAVNGYEVPDTSAVMVKYVAGTNFAHVANTYPTIPLITKDNGVEKMMAIPGADTETYYYDITVTLSPSNRVYKISKITHENSSASEPGCVNTVSYYVNESLCHIWGNMYSSIPNTETDFIIQYH